jgi:hypothetical protein
MRGLFRFTDVPFQDQIQDNFPDQRCDPRVNPRVKLKIKPVATRRAAATSRINSRKKPMIRGLLPVLIPGENQQRKNDEMTSEIIPAFCPKE